MFGAFVVAWLLVAEMHSRFSPQYIRGASAVVLLLPLLNAPIAKSFGPSVGPLVFLPVFALLVCPGAEYSCRQRCEVPASAA